MQWRRFTNSNDRILSKAFDQSIEFSPYLLFTTTALPKLYKSLYVILKRIKRNKIMLWIITTFVYMLRYGVGSDRRP